ncbi:MAG: HAMP domain-containing protein [Planctomycetes bacterium]|nr:HAMP domain-containing protein [Planctomycetota bacterium]
MRPRTLRTRLAIWAAALAIFVATAVAATFYMATRRTLLEALDESLESRTRAIAEIVRTAGDGRLLPSSTLLRPFAGRDPAHGYDVRVATTLERIAGEYPGERSACPFTDAELAALVTQAQSSAGTHRRISAMRSVGDSDAVLAIAEVFPGSRTAAGTDTPLVVLAYEDFAEIASNLDRVLARLAAVSVLGAFLAVVGALALARRIAAPIEAIAGAAARFGDDDAGHRVPEPGTGDEVDRLAQALNAALARLDDAYARQAQFTADAAHELRTPVSIVMSRCEVALRRDRSADEYREAIGASLAAATRMSDLIDGLLLLARSDAGVPSIRVEHLDLSELVRSVVHEFEALPASAGHAIAVESAGDSFAVQGDAALLAVLLRNLLTNAVVHGGGTGPITVAVRDRGDSVELSVHDEGAGIRPEHLPHVFERFFRGDASRSRATGGSGLGLTIVRRVANLHGGDVSVTSQPGQGCTVTATVAATVTATARRSDRCVGDA